MTERPKIPKRFRGANGRRLLETQLRTQALLGGEGSLQRRVAEVANVFEVAPGDVLIRQGATDNDLYFILSGRFRVLVNGREVAERRSGHHVGEMVIVNPASHRTATVIAAEPGLVARVSEPFFSNLADQNPSIWRAVARTLSERLDARKSFHAQPNDVPIIFIGSSVEQLPVAKAAKASITRKVAHVKIWTDGVFGASSFPLIDLESQVATSDFALLIAGPDDDVTSRGKTKRAPRDNIIFELGLFMGALGHARTFLLVPSGIELKVPSDLLGLTELRYDPADPDRKNAVRTACSTVRKQIANRGPK